MFRCWARVSLKECRPQSATVRHTGQMTGWGLSLVDLNKKLKYFIEIVQDKIIINEQYIMYGNP